MMFYVEGFKLFCCAIVSNTTSNYFEYRSVDINYLGKEF